MITDFEKFESLMKSQIILGKEILTLEEAGRYLGLSKSNLYKLTSKRKIPFYSPGGKKIYFKKSEIISWVTSNEIPTSEKQILETEIYLGKTSRT